MKTKLRRSKGAVQKGIEISSEGQRSSLLKRERESGDGDNFSNVFSPYKELEIVTRRQGRKK